ncbi:lipopolysaccharide kinase InaA family protein, partial [Pseudomonas aeruginosa]
MIEALAGFSCLDECSACCVQDRWCEAKHQRIVQHISSIIARMNLVLLQRVCLYPSHIFVRVECEAIDVAPIYL